MKYFLLLVQERKVKIPAPVWEVTACAAAAAVPPLPPHLPVVLHGKFDCESRCFTPKVLSDMSYSLFCSHIFQSLVPQISATSAPLLSAHICTQKEKNTCFLKQLDLASMKSLWDLYVYVTQQALMKQQLADQVILLKVNMPFHHS